MKLETASRDRLLDLAGTYHVVAILTGHTHDSHYQQEQRRDATGAFWVVRELTMSSTVGWPEFSSDEAGFSVSSAHPRQGQVDLDGVAVRLDGTGYACSANGAWKTFDGPF